MNLKKIIIYSLLTTLAISGFTGFLIDESILSIDKSITTFILDVLLFLIAIASINKTKQIRKLLLFSSFFLIISIISYILNSKNLNLSAYANGLREFLPYFLFPIIYINILQSNWRNFLISKFNTFLYIFLVLQIPVSIYQFLKYGAGDFVGGTQGAGFSGILTFLIFLSTYYLMIKKFDENNFFKNLLKKSFLFIFWLPAFINETKISFILILCFFLLIVKLSFSNIKKIVFITFLILPIFFFFNFIYQNTVSNFTSTDFLDLNFLENYLATDDTQKDIPRLQKIGIVMLQFNNEEILWGKGVGQFKGGSKLSLTPFATKYEWLLSGSVPMFFFLLVQIGLIGAIWFIIYWFFLISFRPEQKQRVNYSTNLIIFTTVCYIIIQVYDTSFRFLFPSGIIMYFLCYAISENSIKSNEKPRRISVGGYYGFLVNG